MRVWNKVGDEIADLYAVTLNKLTAEGREAVPVSEMAERLGITFDEALKTWDRVCAAQSATVSEPKIRQMEQALGHKVTGGKKRKRKNYTLDKAKILKLLAAGKSLRQVARECGTTHVTVRNVAMRAGDVTLRTWILTAVNRLPKLSIETLSLLQQAKELDEASGSAG